MMLARRYSARAGTYLLVLAVMSAHLVRAGEWQGDKQTQSLVVAPLSITAAEGRMARPVPYSQDFSAELPDLSLGWEFYSADATYGRISVVRGRLRMDTSGLLAYSLNEAVLRLRMRDTSGVVLRFFQAEFSDEAYSLPERFVGSREGDGVAMSMDGVTWYTVVNADRLDVGHLGRTFVVDLDAEVERVRFRYDSEFGYTDEFCLKFQQYDDYPYQQDGREWDNIEVTASAIPPVTGDGAFTVVLAHAPVEIVTVTVDKAGGDPDVEPSPTPMTFTFRPDNWSVPQVVTVLAFEDEDACDGIGTIRVAAPDLEPVSVAATEVDNETQGLVVEPQEITVPEGGAATFTVSLVYQPCPGTLVFVVAENIGGDSDLQPDPAPTVLRFTADTWDTPQPVTVSGAEDEDVAEGRATIVVRSAGLESIFVVADEQDDEIQEVVVEPLALTVPEGEHGALAVSLKYEPPGGTNIGVQIHHAEGDSDLQPDPNPTILLFRAENWDVPQTATIVASEDGDAHDGTATIRASSWELADVDVAVTEADNDTQGLLVEPLALGVPEGGSDTFAVAIAAELPPDTTVTVTVENTAGDTDLQPSPTELVFAADDWSVPQMVTVTAAHDLDMLDGSATVRVTWPEVVEVHVAVTEVDDDIQTFLVEPAAIAVPEGGHETFTVRLAYLPLAGSVVTATIDNVAGDDDLQPAPDPTVFVFDISNWDQPQEAAVTAAEDVDAAHDTATIQVGAPGAEPTDLLATEADNETQRLVVAPLELTVLEGDEETLTVRLAYQPGAGVPVVVTIDNVMGDTDLQPDPAVLSFTASDWNRSQTVAIAAAEDPDADDGTATIGVRSTGLADVNVTATEDDNDAQMLIVEPLSVTVAEGGQGSFTVRLATEPRADMIVTVERAVGDADLEVDPDPTYLLFTLATWAEPQTVTITAAEDGDATDGAAAIRVSAPGLTVVVVIVFEDDNDTQSLVVAPATLGVPEGGQNTFTLRLAHEPSAGGGVTVIVENVFGDPGLQPSPAPALLSFTADDWDQPQTVTVTAADDVDACDGVATMRASAPGLSAAMVTATEDDDEAQALVVAPLTISVPEAEGAMFAVALTHEPCVEGQPVSVVNIGPDLDLVPTPPALLFTPADWAEPQTVTVSATADEDTCDGEATIRVGLSETSYVDVRATEVDRDQQALVAEPQSIAVPEQGQETFTVTLERPPCDDVTVTVSYAAGDPDLQPDSGALTFTPEDWDAPQTVTVTAAADADVCDGTATIQLASDGLTPVNVTATEIDAQTQGLVVEPLALMVPEGRKRTFTVRLLRQICGAQTATVTVDNAAGDADLQPSPDPAILTFTSGNWDTPQEVEIAAGADEDAEDGRAVIRVECADCGEAVDVTVDEVDSALLEDFETQDFAMYPWITYGDAEWSVDCQQGYQSDCAARSGPIAQRQETVLEISREVPRGRIRFRVMLSMLRRDKFIFQIDGKTMLGWTGSRRKWKKAKFHVRAGEHTFGWIYKRGKKETSEDVGVWIDDVRFEPRR